MAWRKIPARAWERCIEELAAAGVPAEVARADVAVSWPPGELPSMRALAVRWGWLTKSGAPAKNRVQRLLSEVFPKTGQKRDKNGTKTGQNQKGQTPQCAKRGTKTGQKRDKNGTALSENNAKSGTIRAPNNNKNIKNNKTAAKGSQSEVKAYLSAFKAEYEATTGARLAWVWFRDKHHGQAWCEAFGSLESFRAAVKAYLAAERQGAIYPPHKAASVQRFTSNIQDFMPGAIEGTRPKQATNADNGWRKVLAYMARSDESRPSVYEPELAAAGVSVEALRAAGHLGRLRKMNDYQLAQAGKRYASEVRIVR